MDWTRRDKLELEYRCLRALDPFIYREITPMLRDEIAKALSHAQWEWFAEKLFPLE